MNEVRCPGCGLVMPKREVATYHGYYNASPECWLVYTEVLAAEYSSAVLFGQVHQLTVDTYAVQHAGGAHPDKSVDVHLSGLHLILEQKQRPVAVAPMLQRLASVVDAWPHFAPPSMGGAQARRAGTAGEPASRATPRPLNNSARSAKNGR